MKTTVSETHSRLTVIVGTKKTGAVRFTWSYSGERVSAPASLLDRTTMRRLIDLAAPRSTEGPAAAWKRIAAAAERAESFADLLVEAGK